MCADIRSEMIGHWTVVRWPEIRHHFIQGCSEVEIRALDDSVGADGPLAFSDGRHTWYACVSSEQSAALANRGVVPRYVVTRAQLEEVLLRAGYELEDVRRLRLRDVLALALPTGDRLFQSEGADD